IATAPPSFYPLSLHDALPIYLCVATETELTEALFGPRPVAEVLLAVKEGAPVAFALFFHNYSTFLGRRGLWLEDLYVMPEHRRRSEEHTSELQSRRDLVCRLL